MNFVKSKIFLIFFLRVNLAIKLLEIIPIRPAWYFKQTMLNFNRLCSENHLLGSLLKFSMHKTKPGALTTGTVKSSFKGTKKKFVSRENAFLFVSSVT